MEPLLVDKSTAAEILSISIRGVERLIAEKRLPSVRIRRLVRIPVAALRLLAKCDRSDKAQKCLEAEQPDNSTPMRNS